MTPLSTKPAESLLEQNAQIDDIEQQRPWQMSRPHRFLWLASTFPIKRSTSRLKLIAFKLQMTGENPLRCGEPSMSSQEENLKPLQRPRRRTRRQDWLVGKLISKNCSITKCPPRTISSFVESLVLSPIFQLMTSASKSCWKPPSNLKLEEPVALMEYLPRYFVIPNCSAFFTPS